ncbi:hypothetical protein ACIOMM_34855 [Streptomyces sp. NPDC087908]|uniref:hypothetical protein n=1 Tax=Streptomyces sp. NPDC087908 TaxID=3365820 RepID=UPI003821641D
MPTTAAVLLSSIALPGLSSSPAQAADCVPRSAVSTNAWNVVHCGVPDIDQHRNGLDATGEKYCVPTAAMNALFWFDKNGYPNMLSGNYDAMSSEPNTFSEVTRKIKSLAARMNTQDDGTIVSDAVNGLNSHIAEKGYSSRFQAKYRSVAYDPSPGRAVAVALAGDLNPGMAIGKVIRKKNGAVVGGHAVSLTASYGAVGGLSRITIHDPGTQGFGGNGQSPTIPLTYELGTFVPGLGHKIIGYGYNGESVYFQGMITIS